MVSRCARAVVLVTALAFSSPVLAQITVEGVAPETVYTNSAEFRVVESPGFSYTVTLNGEPQLSGELVEIDEANYFELVVVRREDSSSSEDNLVIPFIVRDSSRGNSEWGLRPWVPHADVPSAAAEFVGASIEIVIPAEFPAGLEVPVVLRVVEDGTDKRVGVLGEIAGSFAAVGLTVDHTVRLFRGVGSDLANVADATAYSYSADIHGLHSKKAITIEPTTTWTTVSGLLDTSAGG